MANGQVARGQRAFFSALSGRLLQEAGLFICGLYIFIEAPGGCQCCTKLSKGFRQHAVNFSQTKQGNGQQHQNRPGYEILLEQAKAGPQGNHR